MLQVWKNIRYINNDFTNKNRSSWLSEISCSVVKDRVHGHACVSADEGGLASTVLPGEQRREHVFSICFPVRESSHNGKTRNATSTMASQLKNTVRGSVGPGREPSVCTPCAVWGRRSTPAHTSQRTQSWRIWETHHEERQQRPTTPLTDPKRPTFIDNILA